MIRFGSYLTLDTNGVDDVSDMGLYSSYARAISGYPIYTQWTPIVETTRRYIVILGIDEAKDLREFAATTEQPFDFLDHEGVNWIVASGTDDETHKYSTGAYFSSGQRFSEKPSQGSGYYCNNMWTENISVIINARFWNGNTEE